MATKPQTQLVRLMADQPSAFIPALGHRNTQKTTKKRKAQSTFRTNINGTKNNKMFQKHNGEQKAKTFWLFH